MKRNRLMYALPLACLLAAGAVSRLALADTTTDTTTTTTGGAASSDSGYNSNNSMNADPSRPNDNAMPQSSRSSSSGSTMKDSAITAKVKSALLSERDLPSSQIKVETNNGVVQLSGFLNSQAEIDRAVSVARNVKDVKSVENNIQTK